MYIVRNEHNILICKITENILNKLLLNYNGERKIKRFSSNSKMCYIINEDGVITVGDYRIYLWEGYYIELYTI